MANATSRLAGFSFHPYICILPPWFLCYLAVYRIRFVVHLRLDFEFGASRTASIELARASVRTISLIPPSPESFPVEAEKENRHIRGHHSSKIPQSVLRHAQRLGLAALRSMPRLPARRPVALTSFSSPGSTSCTSSRCRTGRGRYG
jgi:hypothetical protein